MAEASGKMISFTRGDISACRTIWGSVIATFSYIDCSDGLRGGRGVDGACSDGAVTNGI